MACVVEGCNSHSGRIQNTALGLTFHKFPKDEILISEWIRRIGKKNWSPTIYSKLCSKHFHSGSFLPKEKLKRRRLKPDAVPMLIIAGAILTTVAGLSAFIGFSATLATAKKADPKYFSKGIHGSIELADAGAILAMRALGWGTVYAVAGTSCLCFGIWKLSGATDLKDFRIKMGNILPALPKNNPPQSRTEFSGLNDLMTYLSEEYGKKK